MNRDADMIAEVQSPKSDVDIELPGGFVQHDAFVRIAAYVASQLHAGLSEREIMRRLHGYQRTEGE